MSDNTAIATFGAGCFWGVEVTFRNKEGVINATVGYSGGSTENPSYEDVCTGTTGHAEVVQVQYDEHVCSYDQLLELFWSSHDPTQINRQGPDRGTQYRSVIFTHSDAQAEQAAASRDRLEASGRFDAPIATTIEPAGTFYSAEDYHQQYLQKRGLASCRI